VGGEYYAAGVGGSITGRRADLGIIDDPVRGREDADSERARETAWQWYVNDFLPRLKPGASQIVIMTRWHEDDLGGRLLDREANKWRVVELPMEALPGDPLRRKPGERLWPEWFRPRWWRPPSAMPVPGMRSTSSARWSRKANISSSNGSRRLFICPENVTCYGASDYAVTDGGGDYTEHGIFAVDPLGTVYIIDWWRGQTVTDIWVERQCDLILKHQPLCWFGQKGVIEKAVRPYLTHRMNERRAYCRIEWLPSVTEKTARARSFQALASMNKVMVPVEASWKAELLGQLTRFPAGKVNAALALLQANIELDDISSISEETKATVLAYNRDDCRSAAALRDWLEGLRQQLVSGGTPVPRPEPGDGAPNEKITDWLVRINAVIAKLTADFEIQRRLPGVQVGTVDKFQGQEAPIAIYSTATSSRADAPRGMEFLYSLNRLNVATSRAKCMCVMVGSPDLFEVECRTPRQAQLANAFCRFLELARPVPQS
jgi:predicted phage terminase large subunit-like protein